MAIRLTESEAAMLGCVFAIGVSLASEPSSVVHLDLASETNRQVLVDREPGQYLGHPSTVLLEDGRTILCVYPRGHGRGIRLSSTGSSWSWEPRGCERG